MKLTMTLSCFIVPFILGVIRPAQGEPLPGGFSEVSPTNAWVMSAAAKAIQAQAESLSTPSAPAHLTLVSIVGAKQQVVAGMNYRLQLKVDLDGTPREAEAVVWRKLSGEYKLTSWNWK